jgi:hypothetical protein
MDETLVEEVVTVVAVRREENIYRGALGER